MADPVYSLLQAIDPTKIKVPISERFSKLTLSSNKKQNKREENEELDNDGEVSQENVKAKHEKRQSASRNLMEELSQESYSSPQNPLLRSESSKEQSNGNNVSVSHFTDYETMDPLNVTEDDDDNDEEEEHSHANTENQTPPILDVVVDDLLHKISAMDIISRPISISSTCSSSIGGTQPSHDLNEVTQLISTESQRSSMGDVRTFHNIIEVPVKTVFKKEIVSVTPKSNIQHRETQNNEYEMTEDEDEEVEVERRVENTTEEHSVVDDDIDDDDDDEDEAITISDTSNSDVAEEEPSEMAMSAMNTARGTLSGLSPEKIDRMTAFLRDVSIERRNLEENGRTSMENFEYDEYLPTKNIDIMTKAHRIAKADTESMTPEGEEDEGEDKVTKKSLLERQERLKAFDETKQEETSQIYEDEANATRSPEEENNVRRLANDETQDNSIMTDLQFSPSQHYDIKEEKTPQNNARRIVSAETQENTTNFELEEVLATSVITPKNETPKKSARRLISAETEENTIQTEGQLDLSSASHGTSFKDHKTPLKSDHRRLALDETEVNTQLSLSTSSSPEKNNNDKDNAKRLANDDTEVNTEFSTNSSQELKVNEKNFSDADTDVDRSISVPSSPDIKNKQKNIAEADTEIDNSAYIVSSPEMKTPQKSYGSVNSLVSSSPVNDTAPEHSITILETDDEDEDAQLKSPQSDDNNKLSTSFHKDEYVSSGDDSDSDDQMSQIQMSMANINISAKINIKIHIPDSTETSEDGGDSSDNRRSTLDSLPEQPKSKQTPSKGTNKESIPSQNTEIIKQSKKTPSKSLKNNYLSPNNSQNDSFDHDKSNGDEEISSCPSSDNSCAIVEEDEQFVDVAQKLLNQLYGNSWQTPDVIRTLTRTSGSAENNLSKVKNDTLRNQHKSKEKEKKKTDIKECSLKVAEESVLGDFSMFRRNIVQTNLDSTRLVTPKSKSTKDKGNCLTEPRNNRKPSTKSRNEEEPEFKAPQTEVRRQRLRTPAVAKISANQIRSQNERWRQLIDNSDSEAEGNNASDDDDADRSDESWKAPEEEDSDFEPSPEKPKEKNKKNITNKREVTIKKPVVTNKKSNRYEISSESDIEEGRKSDVSWQKGDDKVSVSDDSDFETPQPKVTKKQKANPLPNNNKTKANSKRGRNKKRDMSQDDLVYLDLSKEEVSIQEDMPESPPANHDVTFASRLNDILKTCRHEDKPKLPSSAQSTKTKRKLFTPMFGHDLEGDDPALPEIVEKENKKILVNENESIILDNITCPFDAQGRPKKLDVVNKQLESVKAGKPIFKLTPSPKKKADTTPLKTRTEKNNETPTSKTKAETKTKSQTPTTRKGEPTNLSDLCRTPDYKYSFLKSLDVTVSKVFCHPDALYYRDNYRTKKEDLANILYELYNKNLFGNKLNVPLTWNKKLSNTAGRCLNKKKLGVRSSVIELSEKVLTSADRLRCTLIHELCHAATWIFNGEGGHGRTWKEWAHRANATFPEIPKIGVCHQYEIEYKYTYKCTLCGAKSYAHSKSKKVENIRCSYCHGAIEIFLNKKDKEGNIIPTPVKEPTGFAKFVKDNYKKYKREDTKHADVMKILSNEFATLKLNGKT